MRFAGSWRDWTFLVLLSFGIGLIFAIPIVVFLWLIVLLAGWHRP
jgi:hypothetical protein